jgi:hypothetical protein
MCVKICVLKMMTWGVVKDSYTGQRLVCFTLTKNNTKRSEKAAKGTADTSRQSTHT